MYSHLPSIPHTVDAQGFVLVDGKRVLCRPGEPLRSQPTYQSPCQMACGRMLTLPLRVVAEYEAALSMTRYFHAPSSGAESRCAECKKERT